MELGLSGLASGFDWRSMIDQLSDVERAPQRRLRLEQSVLQERNNAYSSVLTQLGVLRNRVNALKSPDLFESRLGTSSDTGVATAAASTGAAQGNYTFNFTQLATAARHTGATGAARPLHPTNDVSGLVLQDAGFASAVTAGKFTVNGSEVSVAATDTLQQVFDKISTATGGAVTASYNAGTDRISLNSGSQIILGSATDSSNFLQLARLNNNGSGAVTSSAALGGIRLAANLESANFSTAVSDGGSGQGLFKINGVEISYNASTDSASAVLKRINDSGAGVIASYDTVNNRFSLANKATGDVGIALVDVTGNFLSASRLTTGTLERGKDLIYTVNGGGQLTSKSNTVTEASSGLAGLSVTALKEGSTTVRVNVDAARIKTAITDFVTEYNKVQSMVDGYTASTTDSKGKVTAGPLTGEGDANEISSRLRGLVTATLAGTSSVIRRLEGIGISSNGNDNTLKIDDTAKLDTALSTNLSGVRDLFSSSSNGIGIALDAYLEKTIGENGSLLNRQSTIRKQSTGIDTQIADMERMVQANRARMTSSFVLMEQAQAKINQQLQFLSQRFGSK